MNPVDALPNRRIEGWRWSDLAAALAGLNVPVASGAAPAIVRLAPGGPRRIVVDSGGSVSHVDIVGEGRFDAHALNVHIRPGGSFTAFVAHRGEGVAVSHRSVVVEEGGVFRLFALNEGARFSRIETEVEIAGPGVRVEVNGVYVAGAKNHADLTSLVTLKAEGAEVRQLVRGVARGRGRGVFQGKFKVERAAQKTDAEMQHNALILEEGAEVFAKPELEIYADDVACSHGNTVGQLDESAIFYLRSRGVPEAQARAMITRAFLIEALPDWLDETVRGEVEARIDAWLGAGHG